MPSDKHEGAVSRDQLETAKMLLEGAHGMALRDGRAGEAYAFNEGIEVIEDAMEGKFKPDAEPHETSIEDIQRSRNAREEGYEAATLMDQRFGTDKVVKVEKTDEAKDGLVHKIGRLFQ